MTLLPGPNGLNASDVFAGKNCSAVFNGTKSPRYPSNDYTYQDTNVGSGQ